MATYQNTSVDSDNLVLGNYKIETAATAGGTYVNLGAGILNSFGHNVEMYDVQAGNAPDPIEGVADETATFGFSLIEWDQSVLSVISGGLMSASTVSSVSTMVAGGATVLTPRAYRLTNRRMIGTATVETVITIFKALSDQGLQVTAKSDNDTDPINTLDYTVTGKIDATRTVAAGQLFSIRKDIA